MDVIFECSLPLGGIGDGEQTTPADHPVDHDSPPVLAQGRGAGVAEAATAQLRLTHDNKRS